MFYQLKLRNFKFIQTTTRVSGLRQQVIWLENTNVLDEFLPLSSGYICTYTLLYLTQL